MKNDKNDEKGLVKYVPPEELFMELQTERNDDIDEKNSVMSSIVKHTYKDLAITPEQSKAFRRHISYLKHGLNAAMPLICCGKRCPFFDVCAAQVFDIEKDLQGKPCIVEVNLLGYYRQLYFSEFEIEEGDIGTQILINELAELDIYDFRATLVLSLGDSATGNDGIPGGPEKNLAQALMTNVPHYNEVGTLTHVTQDVHTAFLLKEKFKNRKLKLLELLVATRKEQYKKDAALKAKSQSDIADDQRKVLSRIEEMTKRVEEEETDKQFYETFIEDHMGEDK